MCVCRLCGIEKSWDDFYKHPKSKTGYDSKCKECTKSMMKAARVRNIEHYKEFDRQRAMRPDRVAARKAYRATEKGKEAVQRAHRNYEKKQPERHYARIAFRNAVRDGKLFPWPVCAVPECDCTKVEGHHPDYSRPLDVVWLCNKHHREVHNLVRGKNKCK